MPDKKRAAFASDRLREVLVSMRDVWRKSLEEVPVDGSIDLYIVDADVVMMFMAPLLTHNYGALLRYEGHARKDNTAGNLKELETRLVEFLGNLIFFQLRPTIPLLLLPGHADDLERILSNIWIRATKELGEWERVQEAIGDSLSNAFETSKSHLINADRTIKENANTPAQTVDVLLREVFSSLRGEGAVGQLFRFDALMTGHRLRHLDQMVFKDCHGRSKYLPPPLTESGKYLPSVSRLADRLDRVMVSRNMIDNPSKRLHIRRDAQALAHLAWLNDLFREDEWYVEFGDGTTRRIKQAILISGSHLLPYAIEELELRPLRGSVVMPLSFLGHRVMDQYFRRSSDPIQTRVEDSAEGCQASALINFFDSMRGVLDSALASQNSSKITNAVKDVQGQQNKMAEKWQSRQLFGQYSRMEAVAAAMASLEGSGRSLDKLRDFLEELSVDAWQAFARSVTMLSLKSVSEDKAVLRNIPPVWFRRFSAAKVVSSKLYRTGDTAEARKTASLILNKASIKDLKHEDPSHYTEFVCYALFGLVNRTLRSAEGCAEVAWSIAQSVPKTGTLAKYIKGDEALYLLSHIIRLRAHTLEHLKRAERCILLAVDALREAEIVDEDGVAIQDYRYLAERFSIRSHQRYMECLGPVGAWHPLLRNQRDPKQLKLTYAEGLILWEMMRKAKPEDELYAYEYVKQQILVNLAQLGLFSLYRSERIGVDKIEIYGYELDAKPVLNRDEREKLRYITTELIEQCEMLDKDQSGILPKPSLLATSVAAVSNLVFRDNVDLDGWFSFRNARVAALDGLRFTFLDNVYNYCKKARALSEINDDFADDSIYADDGLAGGGVMPPNPFVDFE